MVGRMTMIKMELYQNDIGKVQNYLTIEFAFACFILLNR